VTPKIPLTTPLGKIKDTALGALRNPLGTAGKVVDQARGTASLGKSVAGGVVGGVVGQVSSRVPVPGRHQARAPRPDTLRPVPSPAPAKQHGDPLAEAPAPDRDEFTERGDEAARPVSASDVAGQASAKKAAAKKAPSAKAKKTATPDEEAAASVEAATSAKKAAAKKAPSKRAAVTDPALRGPAKDEIVYTSESTDEPAGPGDRLPPRRGGETTESLIDPSTTKQVANEAERGLRAADGQPD
jgi:hypothetical protein